MFDKPWLLLSEMAIYSFLQRIQQQYKNYKDGNRKKTSDQVPNIYFGMH